MIVPGNETKWVQHLHLCTAYWSMNSSACFVQLEQSLTDTRWPS